MFGYVDVVSVCCVVMHSVGCMRMCQCNCMSGILGVEVMCELGERC